ncbi:uncharacterized protein LOC132631181 [Lycium barbarum]|uniref:uncharacterized protein LOC132631181 n=1 Tax=Lycium barbarum TaxID=112863 RepID=UPI00293E9E18|nr:uncharacterized protein LOC132631181 [Lycium barbarum]
MLLCVQLWSKGKYAKNRRDRKLILFLVGLNEVYKVVRGSILMMNPLPTIAQDFSILSQEEKQKEVKPNNQLFIESASMNVSGASSSNIMRGNYVTLNPNGASSSNSKGPYYQNQNLTNTGSFTTNYNQNMNTGYRGNSYNSSRYNNSNNNKGKRIATNVYGDGVSNAEDGCGYNEQESESGNIDGEAVNFAGIVAYSANSPIQLNCIIVFTEFACLLLQGPSQKRPLEIGSTRGSLYLHCSDSIQRKSGAANVSNALIPASVSNALVALYKESASLNKYVSVNKSQCDESNSLVHAVKKSECSPSVVKNVVSPCLESVIIALLHNLMYIFPVHQIKGNCL